MTTAHPGDGDAEKAVEATHIEPTHTNTKGRAHEYDNAERERRDRSELRGGRLGLRRRSPGSSSSTPKDRSNCAARRWSRATPTVAWSRRTRPARKRWEGTAAGGLIGLLVGILGGPLGVLIGGATGVLVGSLFDLEDTDDTDSVLAALSQEVRPGHDTLLAELREPSDHQVVDAVIESRSGNVLRRPVADVEAEIAAAEKAQREARKKARKELRQRARGEAQGSRSRRRSRNSRRSFRAIARRRRRVPRARTAKRGPRSAAARHRSARTCAERIPRRRRATRARGSLSPRASCAMWSLARRDEHAPAAIPTCRGAGTRQDSLVAARLGTPRVCSSPKRCPRTLKTGRSDRDRATSVKRA